MQQLSVLPVAVSAAIECYYLLRRSIFVFGLFFCRMVNMNLYFDLGLARRKNFTNSPFSFSVDILAPEHCIACSKRKFMTLRHNFSKFYRLQSSGSGSPARFLESVVWLPQSFSARKLPPSPRVSIFLFGGQNPVWCSGSEGTQRAVLDKNFRSVSSRLSRMNPRVIDEKHYRANFVLEKVRVSDFIMMVIVIRHDFAVPSF